VRLLFVPLIAALLSACTTQEIVVAHSVPLSVAPAAYAESELLDVGVVIFESGVPEEELDKQVLEELIREGTFPQIRRAESMFLAVELREALQRSRHWGAVWVTPSDSSALDLLVHGEILRSDGNFFALHITATDAMGIVWLDEDYDMETAASAYNRTRYPTQDPYQDVFNQIANDLALVRAGFDGAAIQNIRTVGELRYASELSPEAFGDYLEESKGGVFEPVRLPAADDPMLGRVRSVRQREQLLFETLDQHYEDFAIEASTSYDSWREFSREDSIRIAEAARAAKLRTGLGALAMALSIAYGTQNDADSLTDMILANSGMYIGNDLLRSAAVRRQERRLHTQSLQELSESFDDEAKPLVVEVRGTQHRLTGTAAAQYEEWQDYMRDLFISETGFVPEEIQVYAEPVPAPTVPVAGDGAAGAGATGASAGGDSETGQGVIVPNAAADDSGEAIANGSGSAPAQV
jgi:hypothetical protein